MVAEPSPVLTAHSPDAEAALDAILGIQIFVAWAGEARSKPRRFGWWNTDLVDEDGGGDLLARLAPRTGRWASLELVREAARRVDAAARTRHGDGDSLRTIFFLGFDLDEKLGDRLAVHKRDRHLPEEVLPLPFPLTGKFPREVVIQALAPKGPAAFEKVPPVGRRLRGAVPKDPDRLVALLAAALLPPADDYPMPFHRPGG